MTWHCHNRSSWQRLALTLLVLASSGARCSQVNDFRSIRSFVAHKGAVKALAYSPSGMILATTGTDSLVRLWRLPELNLMKDLDTSRKFDALAFSPDGRVLAVSYESESDLRGNTIYLTHGGVVLWSTESWRRLYSLKGAAQRLVFSPDGSILAMSGDAGVALWDLKKEETDPRIKLSGGGENTLAVSPDGALLAKDTDSPIQLWSLRSGTFLGYLEGHSSSILSLSFSSDNKLLASSSLDKKIIFWDIASRKQKGAIRLKVEVRHLAFLPASGSLAAGDGAGSVLLIDTESRQIRWMSREHKGAVTALAVAPDKAEFATGGEDGVVRFWPTRLPS